MSSPILSCFIETFLWLRYSFFYVSYWHIMILHFVPKFLELLEQVQGLYLMNWWSVSQSSIFPFPVNPECLAPSIESIDSCSPVHSVLHGFLRSFSMSLVVINTQRYLAHCYILLGKSNGIDMHLSKSSSLPEPLLLCELELAW